MIGYQLEIGRIMAEKLNEVIERFTLSSKKLKELEIILEDMSQDIKECSKSLIGKVVGDIKENFNQMRKFVDSSWGSIKKLKIAEIGHNLFQFSFEMELD